MKPSQTNTDPNNADLPIGDHKQSGLAGFDESNPANAGTPMQNALERAFQIIGNIIKTNRDLNVKETFVVDDIETQILNGQRFKRTELNTLVTGAVYSATRRDYLIGITNLSYSPTVGLPLPKDVGPGKTYLIKDEAGSAGSTTITIRSYDSINIEGALTTTITTNYGSKKLYTDGRNWLLSP